ncbi:MAG: hypothetical protein GX640_05665 [Fibrobacter sp.]|nr:hypothetical protein [Fibrobacter sp.]
MYRNWFQKPKDSYRDRERKFPDGVILNKICKILLISRIEMVWCTLLNVFLKMFFSKGIKKDVVSSSQIGEYNTQIILPIIGEKSVHPVVPGIKWKY